MYIKINTNPDLSAGFLPILAQFEDKEKSRIMNRIFHICDNYGGKPVPPNAKPLFNVGKEELNEFRIELSKTLVRIHYFIESDSDTIVILNAYLKPNGKKDKNSYNKANEKDIDKMIASHIEEALRLKSEYLINVSHYELLD